MEGMKPTSLCNIIPKGLRPFFPVFSLRGSPTCSTLNLTPTASYYHSILPLAGYSYCWKKCPIPKDYSTQELTISKKERQTKETKTT